MTRDVLLGLDIGGSSVKFVLVEASYAGQDGTRPPESMRGSRSVDGSRPGIVRRGHVPTPVADPESAIAEVAERAVQDERLLQVGVTVPGLVDERRGRVLRSTNVPLLEGVRLAEELAAVLGVGVQLVNDGKAAALAEARWGAGREHADVFSLVLGTGVAGAHVVDGEVVAGAHGAAGELGHVSVDPHGELCSCGRRGCLETVIGARALARAWHRAGGSGTARDLLDAHGRTDDRAAPIVTSAGTALAEGILSLLAIVDPGCIVVGGGLASAPHRLVTETAARVNERATFHHVPPIVPAEFEVWAGAWGAVLTAWERLVPPDRVPAH